MDTKASIVEIETIIQNAFIDEPFHNFHLLDEKTSNHCGGTCSDKSLSVLRSIQGAGYKANLHSANIGGQKDIHRLVKVHINKKEYFADVGNGWPSLKLYPLDHEVSYSSFGMQFFTQIDEKKLIVCHTKNGKTNSDLEIYLECKSETEIMTDIDNRFSSSKEYPFSNSRRFSKIVGDEFLFLRGSRLEIYKEGRAKASIIEDISESDLPDILLRYFNFDICKFTAV